MITVVQPGVHGWYRRRGQVGEARVGEASGRVSEAAETLEDGGDVDV